VIEIDNPIVNSGIFFPRPEAGGTPPTGARDFFVEAGPGARIHVRMHPHPEGIGSRPVVLHFHGNGEIVSDYDDLAPAYHSAGASVCFADFRGYGQSSGSPSIRALVADAHPILDGTLRILREERHDGPIAVMGRSLGSAPAIELASARSADVSGLIVESGFARTMPLLALLGIPTAMLGLAELEGDDNEDRMGRVTIPVLLIHAEDDMIVPLWHAERNLVRVPSQAKRLVVIPGADHNDIMATGGRLYWGSLAAFLASLG